MVRLIVGTEPIKIIIPDNANEHEKYAASELRYYLDRMTGRVFPVAADSSAGGAGIYIKEDEHIGCDSFRIFSDDGVIRLSGGKRGVIYSVYELLETLGCRFFTPECEKVPDNPDPVIEDINKVFSPDFEYREHDYRDAVANPRFAVKCRFNGGKHPIKEKYGGNISYAWFVHSFEYMLPPEKYAASHPEYYSLVDGKRTFTSNGRHQLCLTNPEVLDICTENIRKELQKHPEAGIISISQNDWGGNCQCESCKQADAEEGSPSGTLLRFVNAVAERLEDEFPHVVFDTLAYRYTRTAPAVTRNRRNVCVRLCSIECCFSHPFGKCDDETRKITRPDGGRASFTDDLADWAKICDRVYIWDYATCFAHYPTPHPNWRCLQPNMRLFRDNNVKGVYEEANWCAKGGTDLNELRLYLYSKLMWDADADINRHTDEFLGYYYGDAAPEIKKYIDALCDKAENDNIHAGFNDNPIHGFLAEDMLDIYDALFDQAAEKVKGDPLRLFRVEKVRLSIRYVRLKRKAMLQNIHDNAEINKFFDDWREFGLSRMDEWCCAETTHRAMLENRWRGVSYYDHWRDEGGEEF